MKKIAVLMLFIGLSTKGISQSLSFADFKYLLSARNYESFLRARSFRLQSQQSTKAGEVVKYYTKNQHSHYPETIVLGLRLYNTSYTLVPNFSYFNRDTVFINSIISQIETTDLKLVKKSKESKREIFQFKGEGLIVLVNKRQDGKKCQLYFIKGK